MRILYVAIPISMLLAASNAWAQSNDYPATGSAAVSTVQVTAPVHPFHVSEDETMAISGGYRMSNGWRLQVHSAHDGIVAKIDKQPPIRLVAVSADKYVSRDGNVAMEFNRGGDADEMMMSYVPSSNLATVVVMTTSLASR